MPILRELCHHLSAKGYTVFLPCLQPMEVFVDDETKLTLHGLQQYYVKLKDTEKNRKLFDLLDVLEFNQVVCKRASIYHFLMLFPALGLGIEPNHKPVRASWLIPFLLSTPCRL